MDEKCQAHHAIFCVFLYTKVCYVFIIGQMSIHCWNVRGLGKASKRNLVNCLIQDSSCDIVCLHETKLQEFNDRLLKSLRGKKFDCWDVKDSEGSSDGLLTCWNSSLFTCVPFYNYNFSISTYFQSLDHNVDHKWLVTNVYGPPNRQDQKHFFDELIDLRKTMQTPWIISGRFQLDAKPRE